MLQQEISDKIDVYHSLTSYAALDRFRWNFITDYGFSIIDNEFMMELVDVLLDRKILTFTEVYAGNGVLTKALLENGFDGIGYTLPVKEDPKGYGFRESNRIRRGLLKEGRMVYKDIFDIDHPVDSDLLVMSWVPMEGGHELVGLDRKHKLPEYLLYIGESQDGVTGNYLFHDWLEETYKEEHYFESFKRFNTMQDHAMLMKRR